MSRRASKIGSSTAYSYCSERLSPFGGLWGLVKFMELIRFKEIFEGLYNPPSQTPDMGHHNMVYGFIMLLFIGFNRVWHFLYIQIDSMLCSIFHIEEGYPFIFGNKGCNSPFDGSKWYKVREADRIEYNECIYQPMGWKQECRFVAMRISEDEPLEGMAVQLKLFEDDKYIYRIFVTNKEEKVHKVIEEYDKRADSENLIGEAKKEGLAAIVSNKFASNYAYFQIVMLSYNIWRSFKMLAGHSQLEQERQEEESKAKPRCAAREVIDNSIRIARLKLLFIAAKITDHSNTNEVKYSQHDSRVAGLFRFMRYLDERLQQVRPWLDSRRWPSRHVGVLGIKQVAFFP